MRANGICDRSGFKYPLSVLVRTWDGLLVHPRWWEPRHPQDYVTGRRESVLPYTSPEPADVFLTTNQVQPGSL